MLLLNHFSMTSKFKMLSMIISHRWPKRACLFAFLIFGMTCFSSLANSDTAQHRWAGDVPIMNGLLIEPELGFAFDSPDGRIVMIFASSKMSASKIMTFYGLTLAELGWRGGNGNWYRGNEKLVIGAVQTARGPLWRIMLQPI